MFAGYETDLFQSTRPRGARPGIAIATGMTIGFNPRAREGRDLWDELMPSFRTRFNPRAREGRDVTIS